MEAKPKVNRFTPEVHIRAVRMVQIGVNEQAKSEASAQSLFNA